MKSIVIAPHPDDEVLGVGGTLLRRKAEGAELSWLIVSKISVETGFSLEQVRNREDEINRISELFGFDSVFQLNFPTTQLDQVPMRDLVSAISNVFKKFLPEEIFLPHFTDVHTDHRKVFDAVISCAKWFRYSSIKRILSYETLSETEFGLGMKSGFSPNVYINIEDYLENKLQIMDVYKSELGDFPFPRSHEAIRALAAWRGIASGFRAAEAFELLRERL